MPWPGATRGLTGSWQAVPWKPIMDAGLPEAGWWKTSADRMRAEGILEPSIWSVIEVAIEELDADAGEVFARVYELEGFDE